MEEDEMPDEIAVLVRTAFRREYPHVDRCKDEQAVERNWKFPDSALSFPLHTLPTRTLLGAG